jgi:hypothetical protein
MKKLFRNFRRIALPIAIALGAMTVLGAEMLVHSIQSDARDGISASIEWASHGTNLPANQVYAIVFRNAETNRYPESLLCPIDESFAEIRLADKDGRQVAKTPLGMRFGSRFAQISERPRDGEVRTNSHGIGQLYNSQGGGVSMPPLTEIFALRKSGKYWLTIRPQVYKQGTNAANPTRLLRFEPIRVSVAFASRQGSDPEK